MLQRGRLWAGPTVRAFLMVMELSLIKSDCIPVCGDWVGVDESTTKLGDVIWCSV